MISKLIPMVDFVLQQDIEMNDIYAYAVFLKQPINLSMFVPCDEDGNVLEEPDPISIGKCISKKLRIYQAIYDIKEADKYLSFKSKILFEGFQCVGYDDSYVELELKNENIWVTTAKYEFEATDNNGHEINIKTINDLFEYCYSKGVELKITNSSKELIYGNIQKDMLNT